MEMNRKNKLVIGLVAVSAILLGKIFYIQIVNDKYKKDASNNSMVYNYVYPPRGSSTTATGRSWWATRSATTFP